MCRRLRALLVLALASPALASCATQDERADGPVAPGCAAEPARARIVEPTAREVVRMPGEPFDIALGPAARWAVVSLPSTRGPRRLAVLRLDAGRPARIVHTLELGAGLQPFGLDLAGPHLFVAAGAGLLAIDVAPLVLRGTLVSARLAIGQGLIQVDASRDGHEPVRRRVAARRRALGLRRDCGAEGRP